MHKTRLMPEDMPWFWSMSVPTSQGWKVEGQHSLLFTGAQFPVDSRGQVVGVGDIETQTRAVFANITAVLGCAGATWADVVKMNTFYVFDGAADELTAYWEKMTKVRVQFYATPAHCGTGVRVRGLPGKDVLISAAAIAVVPAPAERAERD
jgi:enamine deaminase RidA (YjgF/YER057c/UK114 family)